MSYREAKSFKQFESFIAETDNTYVFNDNTSVHGVGMLLQLIKDMGLNPMITSELKRAMLTLFHIETVNMPNLESGRYILAPNHVSDLDALILGLLYPRIRVVAKNGWMDNERLRQFLDLHYDLCGLDRSSIHSLRALLKESIRYFNESCENRHYLVFSQGTISDFNRNSPERISTIAHKISERTGVPILPVFVEQASLGEPTRIVFDEPATLSRKDDFRLFWLEREAAMQDALTPPARRPRLTEKHSNNNKPGDPFF